MTSESVGVVRRWLRSGSLLWEVAATAFAVAFAAVGGWLINARSTLGIAIAGLAALVVVPPAWLLASAVAMSGGAQQIHLVGSLIAADILLLAWLARFAVAPRHLSRLDPQPILWLALAGFLGWAGLTTVLNGVRVTPILRLALYGAVMLALAIAGTKPRVLYAVTIGFAVVNTIGGVVEGQTRLLGVFVGDPAQMGALLLAALFPLLTGEFRFPGWRAVGLFLLAGIWLTQTRSVWFATIVVATVWLTRRATSRKRTVGILLSVGVVGFEMVGYVTEKLGLNASSAEYRTSSILGGISSGLAHPWSGVGWANADSVATGGVVPYNLFVNVFASVGLPGLVLLLIFLWRLLGCLVITRGAPFYYVTAVLAMSFTEMTLYAGALLTVLFFVYSGIGLHQARQMEVVTSEHGAGPQLGIRGGADL